MTVYAKRSLGQNFLRDPNTAARIVAALDRRSGEPALEIGPGRGALTGLLLDSAPGLTVALEKDGELAVELKRRYPSLQAVVGDGLRFAWEGLKPEGAWKIVGNLPYNVASPIMWEVFSRTAGLKRAVFMVQKEVGLRLVAGPGTKAYGALSVWTQCHVQPKKLFIVGPNVFSPRPKIDSMVLSFIPVADETGRELFDPASLQALLRLCFQSRRKQLGVILKKYWTEDISSWFEEQGKPSRMRPEELTPAEFQSLSLAFAKVFPA